MRPNEELREWENLPILCWPFDTPESWQNAIGEDLYKRKLEEYKSIYESEIGPIIFDMGMKFNLGGEQEKTRLETTSRPIGVFDFSLASQGLYRVQEYYSQELATQYPKLFETFELPSGVVPPNLVDNVVIGGIKNFVYTHEGKTYVLEKRQKGTTAIENGVKDAKLKFATTTKDVYLKFKRSGGKVKYAEIYSLFYFTSLSGDDEFAIRQLPALMTAQYFESIGIKTRVYMTRFVYVGGTAYLKKRDILTNYELPMYKELLDATGRSQGRGGVIFAPIIVKDFGQDLNWVESLAVSQEQGGALYSPIVKQMLDKELDEPFGYYGDPDAEQTEYLTAFARYRAKYQKYVELGIWKSKEIQEDSQLFFHSQSINNWLTSARYSLSSVYSRFGQNKNRWKEILEGNVVARTFFEWWMQVSAGRCRDTLMLMNAREPRKEMQKVVDEFKIRVDDIITYLTIQVPKMYPPSSIEVSMAQELMGGTSRTNYIDVILEEEGLRKDLKNEYDYVNYLNRIIGDATTYARKPLFPTDIEVRERLDERAVLLENEIKLRD